MEATAKARFLRVPPRKARRIVDVIRGKRVDAALTLLRFTTLSAARPSEKIVRAAAANAENNHGMKPQELVIAQGQENSVRADLSFIERARFAKGLDDHGYGRAVIMAALNVDKAAVSKLISVTTAIAPHVIDAIGPAPKTGRAPWLELAPLFATYDRSAELDALFESPAFLGADSDERFVMVCEVFSDKPIGTAKRHGRRRAGHGAFHWAPSGARRVATMIEHARGEKILIDGAAPGFGRFIMQQMDRLYAEFTKAESTRAGNSAGAAKSARQGG